MLRVTPLFLGPLEVVSLLLLVLLLIGLRRIPRIAQAAGSALSDYRLGQLAGETEFEKLKHELDKQEHSDADEDPDLE